MAITILLRKEISKMEFTIKDVAAICNIQELRSSVETFCVCPFCGDKRGKFSYIVSKGSKKNMYHCFACDSHGSMYDLYSRIRGKSDSFRSIRKEIENELGRSVSAGQTYVPIDTTPAYDEAEKTDVDTINKVIRAFLDQLSLSDNHRKNLLSRGLKDDDIKRWMYRSVPSRRSGFAICKKLIKEGYDLSGVPGFYKYKGEWTFFISAPGFYCPAFDENGRIWGMQIRLDEPKNGCKYIWFSSSGKDQGTGSGALYDYVPGTEEDIVIITEGILKSHVISSLLGGKIAVLGVPGVKSLGKLSSFLNRYKQIYVVEAYDMDKALMTAQIPLLNEAEDGAKKSGKTLRDYCSSPKNREYYKGLNKLWNIADARAKLESLIHERRFGFRSITWDTDHSLWTGNYKGLDDYLLSLSPARRNRAVKQLIDSKNDWFTIIRSIG